MIQLSTINKSVFVRRFIQNVKQFINFIRQKYSF